MSVQASLKDYVKSLDFEYNNINIQDIVQADANTRYRLFLRTISEQRKLCVFGKKGKLKYYDGYDEGTKMIVLVPDRAYAEYCKSQDADLADADIMEIDVQTLLFDILPKLEKRKAWLSICTNLTDSVEIPAEEFKIEWFTYMLYELN